MRRATLIGISLIVALILSACGGSQATTVAPITCADPEAHANHTGCDFRQYNFQSDYLEGTIFNQANLEGANFNRVFLVDADFRNANLSGANMGGADLRNADLREANLSGTNFDRTELFGADLRDTTFDDDTTFEDAVYDTSTLWPTDLVPEERGATCEGC